MKARRSTLVHPSDSLGFAPDEDVLSLSFLDVLCCGLCASLFLFFILASIARPQAVASPAVSWAPPHEILLDINALPRQGAAKDWKVVVTLVGLPETAEQSRVAHEFPPGAPFKFGARTLLTSYVPKGISGRVQLRIENTEIVRIWINSAVDGQLSQREGIVLDPGIHDMIELTLADKIDVAYKVTGRPPTQAEFPSR